MKLFTTLSLVLALAAPALAQGCQMTTSAPEITTAGCLVTGAPCHYVDNDPSHSSTPGEGIWSIWVYEESNGIGGLQRGDEVHDDVCGGTLGIASDTIIF